jgi:hypothetical protein
LINFLKTERVFIDALIDRLGNKIGIEYKEQNFKDNLKKKTASFVLKKKATKAVAAYMALMPKVQGKSLEEIMSNRSLYKRWLKIDFNSITEAKKQGLL